MQAKIQAQSCVAAVELASARRAGREDRELVAALWRPRPTGATAFVQHDEIDDSAGLFNLSLHHAISDWWSWETHDAYVARLRREGLRVDFASEIPGS